MSMPAKKLMSVEEFLAFEQVSEVKHEFFDGEIFAMAGGTAMHSLIIGNLVRELGIALKNSGCRVLPTEMMVFSPLGLRTYPDISVVCDRPRYEDDRQLTLLNPLAIVEVLSQSTEAYDRGKKFDHYQSIESLREYVLVSQDRAHVDRFTLQDGGDWVIHKHEGLDSSLKLPSLDCEIAMSEIYSQVEFPKPSGESSVTKQPS